ncbi:CHASE2 domain-containing protein [Pseudorhodoferax sp. Leaf274]|uniref:CHASE2 domain-containing protein n=1 Tax=Pseudorhodoferax sp. Leaf274 TaxID=1736318 RepID=UPI0007034168|nr:adenylate/guanylate cyclase domain-containing protein [Pseudorhodoferax sp. Leaf274]KQP46214.1 guanylate cyclase [Pseudorhodoferax sp. Leaf274]
MTRRWRMAGQAGVLGATLALALAVLLADPAWLRALRHGVFDQYQRWQPRSGPDMGVRIVDVDEDSLARLGQWPWPRTRLAELVERARAGGAAAIGFDAVFAEPDRSAPRALPQLAALPAAARAAVLALPDPDARFAASLADVPAVLGFSLRPDGAEVANGAPASLPERARFVQLGASALAHVPEGGSVVAPLPLLAQAAAGHGALSFLPDGDGVLRRVPLVLRTGERLLPSLSAEMLRVAQGQTNYLLRADDGPAGGLTELRVGRYALPVTAEGELWLHYGASVPARRIPAWQLLQGQVDPASLRGRLLLVGSSAQGLQDLRFTPLGSVVPGVEVHAQALEQMLSGALLRRPAGLDALEALALLLGGLLVGTLAFTRGPLPSAAALLAVVGAFAGASWWAFSAQRLLVDPLAPALGVLAAFGVPSVLRHHASEQRRRWLARAFSRYVSPNLVSHIVRHPEQLALSGERRHCSFIFTDLAGFTGLMERIDPADAVGLVNGYLDGMIAIVFRHQGTLDRFIGDALAIMFSAPLAQRDHRQRAYDCALEMQRFADGYARGRGRPLGHTRIGVHSGEVIVGNFGGHTMFDYRALGDAVNTAARLEGANKYLGTRVCVSEALLAGCAGARARPVARLLPQGKTQPLQVYQPLHDGLPGPVDEAAIAAYAAAYRQLAGEAPQALAAFEALAQQQPGDPLVRLHLERLRRGERGDLIVLAGK